MRRLLVAPRAAETVALMQDVGILGIVLGGVGYAAPFARIAAFEAAAGLTPSAARRMAALACRVEEDVARAAVRLRLGNTERDRIAAALVVGRALRQPPAPRAARRLLYVHGVEAYRDGIAYAFAWSGAEETRWRDLLALPGRWAVPKFPLGGRDVIQGGVRGPAVGELLRAVEAWWIEQDFVPDETALRARLQQMMAAAQ
jgi:tRNA nucleotidyltransferase/poly(A) polymerase